MEGKQNQPQPGTTAVGRKTIGLDIRVEQNGTCTIRAKQEDVTRLRDALTTVLQRWDSDASITLMRQLPKGQAPFTIIGV